LSAREVILAASNPPETPMTPDKQQLVRSSWRAIEPIADDAAHVFYARLIDLDPRIAALFRHTDMEKQRMLLIQTLDVVVSNLDRMDQIVPEVEALGRRHAGYGVKAEHYALIGSALLWTLEQSLGDDFTDETAYAWADAYRRISSVMIEAARTAMPAAQRPRRRKWRTATALPLGLAMGSVST
jgi:hemoglobin-like flavoprotein